MNQYPVGDFPGGYWPLPGVIHQVPILPPQPYIPQLQQGCICPAGANVACQNTYCPRKPARPISAIGTSIA